MEKRLTGSLCLQQPGRKLKFMKEEDINAAVTSFREVCGRCQRFMPT